MLGQITGAVLQRNPPDNSILSDFEKTAFSLSRTFHVHAMHQLKLRRCNYIFHCTN